MTDPISDMLTRIRNASAVKHSSTSVPFSMLNFGIAEILAREGWLEAATKPTKKTNRKFEVTLKYAEDSTPMITGIKRVSASKKRIYRGWRELRPVRQGYGLAIVSTPSGLLTDRQARRAKVGGEVLLEIW